MASIQQITFYTYRKTWAPQNCVVQKHSIPRSQIIPFLSIKNKSLLERHILYCPDPLPDNLSSLWQRYITASFYALDSTHLNQHVDPRHQKTEAINLVKAQDLLESLYTDLFIRYESFGIQKNEHFLETLTAHLIGLLTMNSSQLTSKRAFAFFKIAARSGHSDAQYHVAQYYGAGIRRVQNFERAFNYFKEAADQGHPEALLNIGIFYYNGYRTPKDIKKARHYFKQAAIQNIPLAIHNLGLCYQENTNPPQSLEEALSPYEHLIPPSYFNEDPLKLLEHCVIIAKTMLQRANRKKNIRCAFHLLTIVINHDVDSKTPSDAYRTACLTLAKLYHSGFSEVSFFLKPQLDKAYNLYTQAIPLPEAFFQCARLSTVLIRDKHSLIIPTNPDNFLTYLTKAADLGHRKAQFQLGTIYSVNSKNHPQDLKRSFYYYFLAADQNHPEALNIIGCAYYYGTGTKLNYEKAFSYFKKSAECGHDYAFASLAICYENGHGVQQNLKTALKYYKEFARISPKNAQYEQLDVKCKVHLAKDYQTYDHIQANFKKTLHLLTEVTQIKNPHHKNYKAVAEAHAALADIYINGYLANDFIVSINTKKAVFHTKKAVHFFQDIRLKDPKTQSEQASFQFRLALFYLNGVGVDQNILARDLNQYIHFLEQAAINGDPIAQYQLAFHYENGFTDLIEPNQVIAAIYYLKAALQGHHEAFTWVGNFMSQQEQNS